jgi:hypothetical protein
MTPGGLRRLTAAEAGLAREMFGEGLDPVRVRLFALPVWGRAFVTGARLMIWPARGALCDFAAADVPLDLQAVFVHELTHVWQAQNGVNLLTAKLRAGDGPPAYAYDLSRAPAFVGLNIEQQAMLVQHAFLASRGGSAPYPSETYRAMASAWRGSASV